MYLSTTGTYLQASSVGTEFPQSQLDGLLASNNGYKSEAAGLENGWVNFRSSASTFLANYKNNESAAAAGLVVAEKNIEVQKRNLATGSFEADNGLDRIKATNEQSLTSSRIARDSAKSNYENALKNRILTQDRSRLSESDASLALSQAREELDKLTIRSPINGTVTLVQASVGTDVNPGSPMIEIANTNPEVIFDIEASIVPLLKVGSEQTIDYQGKSYTGTVVGLSEVAGANLLYTTRIILAETPPLLGQVATIRLSIPTQYRVLPSSTIRILSESKGELQTFVSGALTPVSVDLGRVIADRMEIITKIDTTTQIVVSDVSNFDPKRSELVQKIISIE